MKLLMFCVFVLSVGYAAATASCMKENVKIEVTTAIEQLRVPSHSVVTLNCDYSISIGEDLPVTITWSYGHGIRSYPETHPVLQCTGYTKAKSCASVRFLDNDYKGRVVVGDLPSLSFNVGSDGSKNYWCNVTLEDAINVELGMDMKGVGLAVDGDTPKMSFVEMGDSVEGGPGSDATLSCICVDSYHCDDVGWFKGSSQEEMQPVITRTSHFRPVPTEIKAYGDWIGRVGLHGNSLIIHNLRESDAGRYWCEVSSSGYKAVGPMAYDTASITLNVDMFTCPPTEGTFADPTDCTKYYVCDNGTKHHMTCPATTIFKEETKACGWPKN